MPRRRAAHTQADIERMLRAAKAVNGRLHIPIARPDGSISVEPYIESQGGQKANIKPLDADEEIRL